MTTSSTTSDSDETLHRQLQTLRKLVSQEFKVLNNKNHSLELEVIQISHEFDQMKEQRNEWRSRYETAIQQIKESNQKQQENRQTYRRLLDEFNLLKSDIDNQYHMMNELESENDKLKSYVHIHAKFYFIYT